MQDDALTLVSTFFDALWNGLSSINVPGTHWSFTGLMIAVFTAGLIGKILHAMFAVFGSHYDRELPSGKREARSEWKGELDD